MQEFRPAGGGSTQIATSIDAASAASMVIVA
jgi:hypothetical protein